MSLLGATGDVERNILHRARVRRRRVPFVEVDEHVLGELVCLVDGVRGEVGSRELELSDADIGVLTNDVCCDDLSVQHWSDVRLAAIILDRDPACVVLLGAENEVASGKVLQ